MRCAAKGQLLVSLAAGLGDDRDVVNPYSRFCGGSKIDTDTCDIEKVQLGI
jgi:hypothetical protein